MSHTTLCTKNWGVIRTLFDRKNNIVTEEDDKIEEKKVQEALATCGFPKWTFEKVKNQMKQKTSKKVTKKKDDTNKCRGMTVLPYVNGVTEKISRVMKSYNVAAASKPHTTLRSLFGPSKRQER